MSSVIDRLLHLWHPPRLWRTLANTVLDLPVGFATFVPTAVLTGLTLGLALALPLAVLPAVALVLWTHLMAGVERSRVAALLDTHLSNPVARLPRGSLWTKVKAVVTSRARWKQLAYCLVHMPVAALLFTVVVMAWGGSLALLGLPVYVGALPQGTAQFGLFGASQGPLALGLALLGLAGLVLIAPLLTLAAGRVDTWLATALLGPPRRDELAARAARAESGRTAAVDAAEAERRRIERDLHDGAQQRLVALAVDLGSARQRLDTDPESGKALVAEAHDEAKAALHEIRDLVRGIHPAILEDRGLDAALSAVVARSPVPVDLTVDIEERPPASVESTAYFVVSEALANVARHARATTAHVAIIRHRDRLVIEVRDDGVGGAAPDLGTGLRGVHDRAVALGGTMDLLSPAGGPTTLLVELPCAS